MTSSPIAEPARPAPSPAAGGAAFPPRRIALLAFLVLALLVLGQVLALLLAMTAPRRGFHATPRDLVDAAVAAGALVRAEFVTADKIVLRGEMLGDPAKRPVVVFGHGFRMDRRQGDPLARRLLAAGYAVFAFDLRGSGESGGRFSTFGALEANDVRAALAHVRDNFRVAPGRMAYVGFSMAGSGALLAPDALAPLACAAIVGPFARLDDTLDARTRKFTLLPLAPFFAPATATFEHLTRVRIAAVDVAATLRGRPLCPLLLLGGDLDWRAPPAALYRLRDAAGDPPVELLPGYDHYDLAAFPPAVSEPILRFIERHLAPGVG